MPALDSRSLAYTDTFAHRLPSPGDVIYSLIHPTLACSPDALEQFRIEVTPSTGTEPRQHTVIVGFRDDQLTADPAELVASAGDFVLWAAAGASIPSFAITGEGDRDFVFASSAMNQDSMFSHVFIQPGDYQWTGANGAGAHGLVHVVAVDFADSDRCREWRAALNEGTLITIAHDTAEPAEVRIVVGQTVMWAVVAGDGVAIIDANPFEHA